MCNNKIAAAAGVVLQGCLHIFCQNCLKTTVQLNDQFNIICPYVSNDGIACMQTIQPGELKEIVDFRIILQNSLNPKTVEKAKNEYEAMLMQDDQQDVIFNLDPFFCSHCLTEILPGAGVVLKDCGHHICIGCIKTEIANCKSAYIRCPYECDGMLQHREIRSLISQDEFDQFLERSVRHEDPNNLPPGYEELLLLDELSGIENTEPFECPICTEIIEPGRGIIARNCWHTFCKICIEKMVFTGEHLTLTCPIAECNCIIEEREIRTALPLDKVDKYVQRLRQLNEQQLLSTIHCITADCIGFMIVEEGDTSFVCNVCNKHNCIKCQVK